MGTVIGIDYIDNIMVKWGNGGNLNVVYGEDVIQKAPYETNNQRKEDAI